MNILILAAGADQSSQNDGYPLCLTEFDDVPLIQRITEASLALQPRQMIVALRDEDFRRYHLGNIVSLLVPGAPILKVQSRTQGAACTALLATGLIDNEDELLIINGNEFLDVDYQEIVESFRARQLDAGLVVFPSVHPRYSYVRLDKNDLVVEAAEKTPISRNATVGFYWFSQGCNFVRATKNMIRKDAHVSGNFYICPAFNELILEHLRIGVYAIDSKRYHPLKTERQIERYEAALEKEKA